MRAIRCLSIAAAAGVRAILIDAVAAIVVVVVVVVAVAVERMRINDDGNVFCRAVAAALMKQELSRVVTVAVGLGVGEMRQVVVGVQWKL